MFSYFFDKQSTQYYVIGGEGKIYAIFASEWEAQDYCNRHNSK